MWKFLTIVAAAVAVLVIGASAGQFTNTHTIQMKSFHVIPRNQIQTQALKNFINMSNGQYFLRSGKIDLNVLAEIFVPINLERKFKLAMNTARIQHGVFYGKAKLKLYGSPNHSMDEEYEEHTQRPFSSGDRSHPTNDSGLYYEIRGLPSQKLVDVFGSFSAENTPVIIYHKRGSTNQRWALNSAPGFIQDPSTWSWFNFVSQNTGKCLTAGVDKKFIGDNTPIVDYTCESPFSDSQMWAVEYDTQKKTSDPNDPTYFKIINKSGGDGKCLTANKNGADEEQLFLLDCNNDDTQFFNFDLALQS